MLGKTYTVAAHSTPSANEPVSLAGRLRQEFDAARFGHYFRTQTVYNMATLTRQWLYGVQDPHTRKCVLMKVEENETGDEEKRLVIGQDMSFISALNYLSRFENQSLNQNSIPVDEGEIERLGTSHYNAFANREGLVRDQEKGEYHPTLNGHVVTTGAFKRTDLERTMGYVENPPARTEKFVIPGHTYRAPVTSEIEQIMAMFKTQDQYQKIKAYYYTISAITAYNLEERSHTSSFNMRNTCKFLYKHEPEEFNVLHDALDDYITEKTKAKNRISAYLNRIDKKHSDTKYDGTHSNFIYFTLLEKLKVIPIEDKKLRAQFNQFLDSCEAAYEFSLCRSYAKLLVAPDIPYEERQQYSKCLEARLPYLGRMADKTGLDHVMKATLLASVHGQQLPFYFEEIDNFRAVLDSIEQEIADNLAVFKQRLNDLVP